MRQSSNLFLCVVQPTWAIAVLFQDGSVKCFGGADNTKGEKYNTVGKNLDSGVIKILKETEVTLPVGELICTIDTSQKSKISPKKSKEISVVESIVPEI